MKYYELTCLISSGLSPEELNSFQEKIISFLQEEKGILVKVNEVKSSSPPFAKARVVNESKPSFPPFAKARVIDSPPKKKGEVLLFGLNFQLNPGAIETFEKKLKADKQIIRYMILAKPPVIYKTAATKPSITFRKKVVKPKVELKEIEKKLEEILGET